jgi:hypothetical protein
VKTLIAILALCALPPLYYASYFPFTRTIAAPGDNSFELATRLLAAGAWRSGTLPLWNPLALCGTPFAADPQTGVLYPLNILYLILPPAPASNITLLLHFSLAGILMFWYLRNLNASRTGSLLGAITYMFSGFLVAHASHTAMQNAAVWAPLVLLCVTEAMRRPPGGFMILGAVAVALQVLAGHLQVVVLTTVPVLLLTCVPPRECGVRAAARLRAPLAIFIAGFLLASALLFPAFEYMRLSPRAQMSYGEFVSYSFHPFLIPLLFFPGAFGGMTPTLFGPVYWGPWNLPELGGGFCGIAPLALAAIAVIALRRSDRAVRAHTVMALAAFALVLGKYNPLYRLMYYVPIYNLFRCPSRNWLTYDFALAALAAFGLDALMERRHGVSAPAVRRAARIVISGLLCIIAACGAFLALFPSFISTPSIPSLHCVLDYIAPPFVETLKGISLRSNAFLFPLAIMCATAMLLHLLSSGHRVRIVCMLFFPLALMDLMSFGIVHRAMGARTERFLDPRHYPEPVKEMIAMGARSGEFRICPFVPDPDSPGNSLAAPRNLFYEIPSCAGYGPLRVMKYQELTGSDWRGRTPDSFVSNVALFSMLNLRYLICAGQFGPRIEGYRGPDGLPPYRKIWEGEGQSIYENRHCLPRAWLVTRARAVSGFDEARGILVNPSAGFNPREEALVETTGPLPPLGPGRGTVDRVQSRPNYITLNATAQHPNLLVFSEIYYPGWNAFVDGKKAALVPVNGILRGIFIPAGNHHVALLYAPLSVRLGLACSGGTCAAIVLGAVASRLIKRRGRRAVASCAARARFRPGP